MSSAATTQGLIDEFESRFTSSHGAHFLISRSGDEAWPISERESVEFRERYRRRMMRARLIRRASLLAFPVLLVTGWQLQDLPRWFVDFFAALTAISLFAAPMLGFFQHAMTSALTREGIEQELDRRFTTDYAPAITPAASPLTRTVRKAMMLAGAALMLVEIGLLIGPRQEHAAHMRVLFGLTAGNESQLALFTGTLAFVLNCALLIGAVILWLDRSDRARKGAVPKMASQEGDRLDQQLEGRPTGPSDRDNGRD